MRLIFVFTIFFSCTKIATAQFSSTSWSSGAYYNTKGIKHKGLLAWTAPDRDTKTKESIIHFKADAQSTEIKIPTTEIDYFVINRNNIGEIDSFIVSKNPSFKLNPIIEVLVYRNPIKLYRSITFVMSKAVRWPDGRIIPSSRVVQFDYYFGPNDEQLTMLDDNDFQEMMPIIMSDNAEATARIKNKDLGFKDILTLLYTYKNSSLPPASAPTPLRNPRH